MSSTLLLLLLFVFLGVLLLWAARREVRDFWARRFKVPFDTPGLPDYWRHRLVGGGVIMLLLATLMGYVFFKEIQGRAELDKYLPVYPELSSASTWFPPAGPDRYWSFESPDTLYAIAAFYQKVASDSGWTISHSGNDEALWLHLEKNGTKVSLFVQREHEVSKLTYQVTAPP
ncbi:MAG: hypothetical protein HKM89_05665 [Gemmatimonadales bacterium]|nr:hypothetical protein [Gemmatimonadales bacterium]